MTLQTIMAADIASLFLATDDFAQTGTFSVPGVSGSFAVSVLMGDGTGLLNTGAGLSDRMTVQAVLSRATVQAGTLALLGAARDPQIGDLIIIASGNLAGTWIIQRCTPDEGGALVCESIRSDYLAPGGENVRRTA